MALDLSKNWRDEALRARLSSWLDPDRLADLFPGAPAEYPTTLSAAWQEAGAPLARVLAASEAWATPGLGSNIWAVGGQASATGKAMLANDPHLRLRSPSVWYMVRLKAPGLDVTGATMPSLPMVNIGRNAQIAWGFTNSGADVQDLFIEEIDPDDSGSYRTRNGSTAFTTRQETISVRGGSDHIITTRESRHGPIISDVANRLPSGEHQAIALRWTALEPKDRTVEAGFQIAIAHDWNSFRRALTLFHSPSQNAAYADAKGHIGFSLAGRVPIRAAGDGRATGSRPIRRSRLARLHCASGAACRSRPGRHALYQRQ